MPDTADDQDREVRGGHRHAARRNLQRVEAHRDNPEKPGLVLQGADEPIAPTHWIFGKLSGLVGAPAASLRQWPALLAGINLQYGLCTAEVVRVAKRQRG